MRYFGSKGSVVADIGNVVSRLTATGSFCDPFGGIGIVGRHFKTLGYDVTSGDILRFATMFQMSSLCRSRMPCFERIRSNLCLASSDALLNMLNGPSRRCRDGWFLEEYSIRRRFFTRENARAVQRCWRKLSRWRQSGLTTELEHAVLMASLIDSADRVANTAGTYYAYLKQYSQKALRPFQFRILPAVSGPKGTVSQGDALDIVKRQHFDVLYLDPPYNERDYASYYHLPETLAAGRQVDVIGQCGIPLRHRAKSRFTRPPMALEAIEELITSASFSTLLFQYADDGLVPACTLKRLLGAVGRVRCVRLNAVGYRTTTGCRDSEHKLYVVTRV